MIKVEIVLRNGVRFFADVTYFEVVQGTPGITGTGIKWGWDNTCTRPLRYVDPTEIVAVVAVNPAPILTGEVTSS